MSTPPNEGPLSQQPPDGSTPSPYPQQQSQGPVQPGYGHPQQPQGPWQQPTYQQQPFAQQPLYPQQPQGSQPPGYSQQPQGPGQSPAYPYAPQGLGQQPDGSASAGFPQQTPGSPQPNTYPQQAVQPGQFGAYPPPGNTQPGSTMNQMPGGSMPLPPAGPGGKKKTSLYIIIGIAAVVVIAVVLGSIYLFAGKKKSSAGPVASTSAASAQPVQPSATPSAASSGSTSGGYTAASWATPITTSPTILFQGSAGGVSLTIYKIGVYPASDDSTLVDSKTKIPLFTKGTPMVWLNFVWTNNTGKPLWIRGGMSDGSTYTDFQYMSGMPSDTNIDLESKLGLSTLGVKPDPSNPNADCVQWLPGTSYAAATNYQEESGVTVDVQANTLINTQKSGANPDMDAINATTVKGSYVMK